ncbi:MoaD/ThiS family protein [uncultured Arcticibacterium sp.]|uniref:MoaD/ThiS family protein n=1 Tax=uncultured Arcticibacterium sp. TaxID=2173042 RepID=UPI0030FC6084
MKVKILCFGITKEILGDFEKEVELADGSTVDILKAKLIADYPSFSKLISLRIAVNEEYGDGALVLTERDEVVLIPPVSGG